MPFNRKGSIYERSSSFTSSFTLIAFTSTLTLFLAHLAARQPQPILQQPLIQQPQPPPSIPPVQPSHPPPSTPNPPPVPPPAPPPAPPSSAPIAPPFSHPVPPLQQPTLIWLGNNGSGILYALLVLVLLFGLSGVWLERIAPSPADSDGRITEVEVEGYSVSDKQKSKKKMQPSSSRSDPSSEDDSEEAKFPGRWMNRMEAKLDRMQKRVDKEREKRKAKKEEDSDSSSSSSTCSSSYEGKRRSTYRYRRSSSARYDHRSCMDHGVRLHKRRDSYCCDHCGTVVAVCAGSGATLDAPPPPIPVLASDVPSGTDEITKIKVESTSTISKEDIEKAVNQELERRLRECEKKLEEEVMKRLKREQESKKKEDESKEKWNDEWEDYGWEKKEVKVTTKTETKVEKKDQTSSSLTSLTTTKDKDDEKPNPDQPTDEGKKVEKEKIEVNITVKEKEKENGKEKTIDHSMLPGILKKRQEVSKSGSNDDDDDEDENNNQRIRQKLHGFRKGISEMVLELKDDAKDVVQDLGEFTQEMKDEAKDKAQDVKDKAKEIVHSVTHIGSESKSDTEQDKKAEDSTDSTDQDVQLSEESVKERVFSKITQKDGVEYKAASTGASETSKSPKSVTFADPIQTEQEIPSIMLESSDKGKGKAKEVEEEEVESNSHYFAQAPMPMPDIVSPYEIDEDRFKDVKSSVSSSSSGSESSSGSGDKEESSKVEEKTHVSVKTTEEGNKVVSTEKVTTTTDTEDTAEKESKDSESSKEPELSEMLLEMVDKIVDGFKQKGKKSKGKSKKDDTEIKVDVSVSKETTPKVEDEKDEGDINEDKGKVAIEESSKSTVKENTKTEISEDSETSTSEKKDKAKEEVVIVGKADVSLPPFTAEELYLETAKYLSEKYPELVAKETVRVNSSLDQTFEEGKASVDDKLTSDSDDQAHQDVEEPSQADTIASSSHETSTSSTNIEEITTKAQKGSESGGTKSFGGEETMLRALDTVRRYGSGNSYSSLESKYYESYFRPKVERSADDVLLSLINTLINQPKESNDKPIKFAASALQSSSKIKEKMKIANNKEKEESKENKVEENKSDEKQRSSTTNFPEKISADAIKAASIATAEQIKQHQARLRNQDESFFTFLKNDTARSFDSMKDEMKDVSSKIGKFKGTLKRKISINSLKGSPSASDEKSSSSSDVPERFDASQVTNFQIPETVKKVLPTPYGIPLKNDSGYKPIPTPYGLNFNKPPIKKPLVQFDRKVNVLEFHDPSTSSSSSSSSTTTTTKQQTSSTNIKVDNVVKKSEEEDVYARITKLTRRLSEK